MALMLDVSTECAASISHTEFSSRSKNRRGFGMCVKKKKKRKELCQETVFHALPCTQPASCPSLLRSIGWLRCRLLFIEINFSICLRSRNLHAFLFFFLFPFHQLGHPSVSQFRILTCVKTLEGHCVIPGLLTSMTLMWSQQSGKTSHARPDEKWCKNC